MLRLRSIGIAIAMFCSLLPMFFVNSIEAAEITSLSASVPDDWGSGANVSAHLGTDTDILYIDWYVDDDHEISTMHSRGTRWVNVHMGPFIGNIKGNVYTIKAVVTFWDHVDNNNNAFVSDDASYDIKVYRPVFDTGTKLDVSGSVYCYSIDYSHPYISPSGDASAYNNGNEWNYRRDIFHRFRHQVTGPGINREKTDETPGGSQKLKNGKSYHASIPSNFPIYVGDGELGQRYTSDVYMRLQVSGDIKVKNPNGGRNIYKTEEWYISPSATFILQ